MSLELSAAKFTSTTIQEARGQKRIAKISAVEVPKKKVAVTVTNSEAPSFDHSSEPLPNTSKATIQKRTI